MVYKHKYFTLDTECRKVFDENQKELRLTGNAYRLLVFLCKNKQANLTQIGEYLNRAKEYTENHIRQYKYRINTVIGRDIMEYENGIYSLIGEVKEIDFLDKKHRNTSLLQEDRIKLRKKEENIVKKTKFNTTPSIIASIVLILSFLNLPYGYYTFLRVLVSAIAIYYAYYLYSVVNRLSFWFWGLVATIILFNPIFPIHFGEKTTWLIIDVIVAIFFIALSIRFKKK